MSGRERRILLIGLMGAGKSTVGRALAERTGWPYVDNDELLRKATGQTTSDFLNEEGVEMLRWAEAQALTVALAIEPPVVAGVAAGVVLDPVDRERMRTGAFVVWLRARIDTLLARVGHGEGRPWLQPDPETAMRRLAEGRDPLYAECAALTVDVDGLEATAIAERILAALDGESR
jgi:shikimate kinase